MESNKKSSIVQKVLALIGMDDKGKVESFFKKEVSKLQKSIVKHEHNLKVAKFNHENKMSELRDRLEDAQTELESAYVSVKVEDIATNSQAEQFSERYWDNVDRAESNVQNITELIEREAKSMEETEKRHKDAVEILTARIEAIS